MTYPGFLETIEPGFGKSVLLLYTVVLDIERKASRKNIQTVDPIWEDRLEEQPGHNARLLVGFFYIRKMKEMLSERYSVILLYLQSFKI